MTEEEYVWVSNEMIHHLPPEELERFAALEQEMQDLKAEMQEMSAPIHESPLRLGYLLKARRSAGRWWSSDRADWKSVVVTWSGRR